jgi:hypothetical protein
LQDLEEYDRVSIKVDMVQAQLSEKAWQLIPNSDFGRRAWDESVFGQGPNQVCKIVAVNKVDGVGLAAGVGTQ